MYREIFISNICSECQVNMFKSKGQFDVDINKLTDKIREKMYRKEFVL